MWQQGPHLEDVLLAPEAVTVGEDGRVIVWETLKKRFVEFHPDAGYCDVIEVSSIYFEQKCLNEFPSIFKITQEEHSLLTSFKIVL